MKKPASKKLRVAGETVRELQSEQLGEVAGGQRPPHTTTTYECYTVTCLC